MSKPHDRHMILVHDDEQVVEDWQVKQWKAAQAAMEAFMHGHKWPWENEFSYCMFCSVPDESIVFNYPNHAHKCPFAVWEEGLR